MAMPHQPPFFHFTHPSLRCLMAVLLVAWLLIGCGGGGGGGGGSDEAPLSAAKEITSFSVLGISATITPGSNASTGAINLVLPYGVNRNALVATFTSTGKSIQVAGQTQVSASSANSFEAPLIYTVIADDGSSKAYTVTITNALNPAKSITAFAVGSTSATVLGDSVSLTLPYGTDRSALVASFTSTGAVVKVGNTVQVSGITANNFNSPVVYSVTAEDGSTQNFTVSITNALNSSKSITDFAFEFAVANISNNDIMLTLPFGVSRTSLIVKFTSTGVSTKVGNVEQVSGISANNFTSPVIYRVTAQDGSSQSYTVNIKNEATPITKWHPGHYILLYSNQQEPKYFSEVTNDLTKNSIFRGIQKKYFWNKLEPTFGSYDFSEIRSDLANLANIKKQLVLSVQAESFITSEKLVPPYLLTDEYGGGVYPINTGTGFNVAYYNKNVQARMVALVEALGKEFDRHPNLEAVNFEETSPSRQESDWNRTYINDYIAGMLRVSSAAKTAFPNTVIIQYVNYPESSLPTIVSTLLAKGIGMGGPDVYRNNSSLMQGVYSYYPTVNGLLPIGMAVDYRNYDSSTGSTPYDKPTVASIFDFATTAIKPNYLFWLRRTAEPANGSNYWGDVLNYLPNFDTSISPTGGLVASCPSLVAPCAPSQ